MWNHDTIRLKQSGPNAFAIGSEIRICICTRDVSREVLVGGGHAGGSHDWYHFGFVVADRITVRVRWPDGKWVHGNGYLQINLLLLIATKKRPNFGNHQFCSSTKASR